MQKFFRGHRVKVTDEMPGWMSHFTSGVDAIIMYSYSDVHGKEQQHSYSLLLLTERPFSSAWYDEGLLTLVDGDRDEGEKLLQEYKE